MISSNPKLLFALMFGVIGGSTFAKVISHYQLVPKATSFFGVNVLQLTAVVLGLLAAFLIWVWRKNRKHLS